jgi:hypothetical protein
VNDNVLLVSNPSASKIRTRLVRSWPAQIMPRPARWLADIMTRSPVRVGRSRRSRSADQIGFIMPLSVPMEYALESVHLIGKHVIPKVF